jgi:hypothetical protein
MGSFVNKTQVEGVSYQKFQGDSVNIDDERILEAK